MVKRFRKAFQFKKSSIFLPEDHEPDVDRELYAIGRNLVTLVEKLQCSLVDITYSCLVLYIDIGKAENLDQFLIAERKNQIAKELQETIVTGNFLVLEQLMEMKLDVTIDSRDAELSYGRLADSVNQLGNQAQVTTTLLEEIPKDEPRNLAGPLPVEEAMKTIVRSGIDIRIGVFGKTGVGKSALCSCIVGEPIFKSKCSAEAVTKRSEFAISKFENRALYVYDTPGELVQSMTKAKVIDFILECLITSFPGFNCLIVAFAVGREPDDISIVSDLDHLFARQEFHKNTIVVFTKTDSLDDGQTFEEYQKTLSKDMKTFLAKCGNRVLQFSNKATDDEYKLQAIKILKAVIDLVENNKERTVELNQFDQTYKLLEANLQKYESQKEKAKARLEMFERPSPELQRAVEEDIQGQNRFFEYFLQRQISQ